MISYKLYLSMICDGFDMVLKKKNSSSIVGKFKYLCLVANQSLGGGRMREEREKGRGPLCSLKSSNSLGVHPFFVFDFHFL